MVPAVATVIPLTAPPETVAVPAPVTLAVGAAMLKVGALVYILPDSPLVRADTFPAETVAVAVAVTEAGGAARVTTGAV